jgi:hypothetical protein
VDFSLEVRSVPQTRQRGASSLTRVPQVGHNLVGFDDFSGLISFIYYTWRQKEVSVFKPKDYTSLQRYLASVLSVQ